MPASHRTQAQSIEEPTRSLEATWGEARSSLSNSVRRIDELPAAQTLTLAVSSSGPLLGLTKSPTTSLSYRVDTNKIQQVRFYPDAGNDEFSNHKEAESFDFESRISDTSKTRYVELSNPRLGSIRLAMADRDALALPALPICDDPSGQLGAFAIDKRRRRPRWACWRM